MYESNEVLRSEDGGCQFQSTAEEYETPHELLSAAKSGELQQFQVFW